MFVYFLMCWHPPLLPWQCFLLLQEPSGCVLVPSLFLHPTSPLQACSFFLSFPCQEEAADRISEWSYEECRGLYWIMGQSLNKRYTGFMRNIQALRGVSPGFVTVEFPFFTPFLHSLCSACIPCVSLKYTEPFQDAPSASTPQVSSPSPHTWTFSSQLHIPDSTLWPSYI